MKTDDMELLRQVDPAAAIEDGPLTERELAGLSAMKTRIEAQRQIAATAPNGPAAAARRTPRRAVLVGAATAMVAAVGLVVVDPFGSSGEAAATPVLLHGELQAGRPARGELLALAAAAEKDKTLPGDAGATHSVRLSDWSLSTVVGKKSVRSTIVPADIELVWSTEQPGHLKAWAGQAYSPSDRDRKVWREADAQGKRGALKSEETYAAGAFDPYFTYPLPTRPAALLAALKANHPIDEYGTGELVVAIKDLNRETVPVPAVRAAVLRLLADRNDVRSLGLMTDRAGRTLRAFSVDTTFTGLPQRNVLMFDASTGALLASEEILTKTPGKLRVKIPSVVGYTLSFPPSR